MCYTPHSKLLRHITSLNLSAAYLATCISHIKIWMALAWFKRPVSKPRKSTLIVVGKQNILIFLRSIGTSLSRVFLNPSSKLRVSHITLHIQWTSGCLAFFIRGGSQLALLHRYIALLMGHFWWIKFSYVSMILSCSSETLVIDNLNVVIQQCSSVRFTQ